MTDKEKVLGTEVAKLQRKVHAQRGHMAKMRKRLHSYYAIDRDVARTIHNNLSVTMQNERLLLTNERLKARIAEIEKVMEAMEAARKRRWKPAIWKP